MNWIVNKIKPQITTSQKRDLKADVWDLCPNCGTMLYKKDLVKNLHVCSSCNYHLKIDVDDRIKYLCTNFEQIDVDQKLKDPLKFRDKKKYTDRLKEAKAKTNHEDAFVCGVGLIGITKTVICALDFNFMAGSMGNFVGEAVSKSANVAYAQKLPLLLITASGGARMQEGIISLMQMAKTTAALQQLKEASLPIICMLTDPTTGGVSASFAFDGDVLLSEPGATIAFAGARVIKETIGEDLPAGFQTSEYLLKNGMIDDIISRKEQVVKISNIFELLLKK